MTKSNDTMWKILGSVGVAASLAMSGWGFSDRIEIERSNVRHDELLRYVIERQVEFTRRQDEMLREARVAELKLQRIEVRCCQN